MQFQFSPDQIPYMSDSEVSKNLFKIKNSINRLREKNINVIDLEIESCYLQREKEIRAARRSAHKHWSSKGY